MSHLRWRVLCFAVAVTGFWTAPARGQADFTIVVDYTYDTNSFFGSAGSAQRTALEAAATRFSNLISSQLAAVGPSGTTGAPGNGSASNTSAGWRIGFTHPGTGASVQVSTAASSGTDPLIGAGAATTYGFAGLTANQWILYAGGRALGGPAGVGGTGTGTNFTTTFNDTFGPMHRGFADNTPANSVNDLPRWGGSISFDNTLTWHFGVSTAAPLGTVDFYSIALHEIGHALGLSTSWNQWSGAGTGSYSGVKAVAAYNADNGTSLTTLNLTGDNHWQDATYKSFIYSGGNNAGTVGTGVLQDLIMEPTANFTTTTRRFELTNVDVAALEDLGWTIAPVPEPATVLGLAAAGLGGVWAVRRRKQPLAPPPAVA